MNANKIKFGEESTIQGRLQRFFGELGHTWQVTAYADKNGYLFFCELTKDGAAVDLLADETNFQTVIAWEQLQATPLSTLDYTWGRVMEDVRKATGIAADCGIPT